MGQSVRTVKPAEAERPLCSPVAVMVWSPGRAEAGTAIFLVNEPVGSVRALARGETSKVRSTTSEGPNPLPWAPRRVVGGPTVLERTRVVKEATAWPGCTITRRVRAVLSSPAQALRLITDGP